MTNTLPEHANLEWLRKAAKRQLKTWHAQGREASLAEAQFDIARGYGFASWRALKAHFDAEAIPELTDHALFLKGVGSGWTARVAQALSAHPDWVNRTGTHPFWGGQPQALHVAIDSNRPEMLALLLAAGADADGQNEGYQNWSPLALALSRGRSDMVIRLRQAGARETLASALLSGNDPDTCRLLDAGALEHTEMPQCSAVALARTPKAIHLLMNAGASPDTKDGWDQDALDTFSRLGPTGAPLVEALKSHGIKPGLRDIARMGDLEQLKAHARPDPEAATFDSVMTAAVDFGHVALAEWLLDQGADVNARQDFGSMGTALHSAAWNGDLEMVKCLLARGADPTLLDAEYRATPLVWAKTSRTVTNNAACDSVADYLIGFETR